MMMNKVKAFFGKCKKKIIGVAVGVSSTVAMAVNSFAAEAGASDTFNASDISTVLDPIKANFTFSNIASILAIVVGAAAVLTLGWFGVRKVISIIQRALKKGKVSV